jgi:hypothetical protein
MQENSVPGSNGEGKAGGKAGGKEVKVDHAYTDHPGYQLPTPNLFIRHLKARLSGVVVDAFRASKAYGYDLPEEFENHIARANTELTVWQRVVNKQRLEQEHPGAANANSGLQRARGTRGEV